MKSYTTNLISIFLIDIYCIFLSATYVFKKYKLLRFRVKTIHTCSNVVIRIHIIYTDRINTYVQQIVFTVSKYEKHVGKVISISIILGF